MSEKTQAISRFKSDLGLADFLNTNHKTQILNFFKDEKQASKFLSSIRADVQRNPKLLEATPQSLVNSYMQMAQFGFMPSNISGEAYVLPYKNTKKEVDASGKTTWLKVVEAQLQIGYQGFVTLFYQAGVKSIYADVVRAKDEVKLINGGIQHIVDPTKSKIDRGEVIGVYVVVSYRGEPMAKYMNISDIYDYGRRFSKSFDLNGEYSAWNPKNDPEYWMCKKTVLKQMSKLLPKNEIINRAIDIDNKDSVMADRLENAKQLSEPLKMNNLLKSNENQDNNQNQEDNENQEVEDTSDVIEDSNPFGSKQE